MTEKNLGYKARLFKALDGYENYMTDPVERIKEVCSEDELIAIEETELQETGADTALVKKLTEKYKQELTQNIVNFNELSSVWAKRTLVFTIGFDIEQEKLNQAWDAFSEAPTSLSLYADFRDAVIATRIL